MGKKNKRRPVLDQLQLHPQQQRQRHHPRSKRQQPMMLGRHITDSNNKNPQKQRHRHHQQHHAQLGGANILDSRQSTREYDSTPPKIRTSEKRPIVISSDDEDDNNENITHSSNPYKRPMWRTIQRRWTSSPHDRYDTFTVMTYNLLSNRLALQNQHLYNRCSKSDIKWENRSKLLMQELRSQMLDIYCLQEIDREHYASFFQPTFREWGYSGVFKKRNGDKPDGCAIFFRNKTVKAVKLLGVNFDENAFTKKENIGIVGIFDIKHQERTRRVSLATSHIIFHPTYGMTKIAQLRMLLDSAREMIVEQNSDIPIVLCGDFNALPYSTVMRYLTDESIDVSALPEWRLSGQQQAHATYKFTPPYENKLTAFHRAFPDNGHGFSPTSKAFPAASLTKTKSDPTAAAATTTRTNATETATTIQIQPSALTWSASSLRSLIRRSKSEWNESTESTSNTSTAAIGSSPTNANSTDTKAANSHIIFNSDGSTKITTTTNTPTTHTSRPGGLICQPFALKSAYPFFPREEAARNLGSNRSAKGGPWTTFHSGGQLVCDYIFYGQLRVPVTLPGANPSCSHSYPTSTASIPQKLQVDGILELPCADLREKGIKSLPCSEFGSDHLSLVARFKFV
ncbi:Endonuclease/exonuclease/phosphatase [Linnemannia elongata]|nr:Endonuclease/exonuclease/phosphatase [Linnemannia elongata]